MLDFAVKMARRHHEATQADLDRLREVGFSDAEILYIVLWIANFNLANTITDVVGLGFHENFSANLSAIFVDEDASAAGSGSTADQGAADADSGSHERSVVRALESPPLEWINSSPLTWDMVRGDVLLIVYWDASHPNSLLGVPHLQRWHEQYSQRDFRILAVHTGEFLMAKNTRFVRQEVSRLGIEYPVAVDPKYRTSAGANNRFWPAIELVDRRGYVRFRHYGPGGYASIEENLRRLLREQGGEDGHELPEPTAVQERDSWLHPDGTPELYVSYRDGSQRRGMIAPPGSVKAFGASEEEPTDVLRRAGKWKVREDGLEKAEGAGSLAFPYRAQRVGLLASPGSAGTATIKVLLDGVPARDRDRGLDLNDESEVVVSRPRFYELVRHDELQSHRLRISVEDDGVVIHRFSFLPALGTEDF